MRNLAIYPRRGCVLLNLWIVCLGALGIGSCSWLDVSSPMLGMPTLCLLAQIRLRGRPIRFRPLEQSVRSTGAISRENKESVIPGVDGGIDV